LPNGDGVYVSIRARTRQPMTNGLALKLNRVIPVYLRRYVDLRALLIGVSSISPLSLCVRVVVAVFNSSCTLIRLIHLITWIFCTDCVRLCVHLSTCFADHLGC